ncbi:DUF6090 family protein [Allomuricauda sp. NBRC 101325]|uniref:DUF6090 family protein n=1 Tax=Allomuricauda sp. NBRC 101325 TaxID=1113758 RepID=UPI0024A55563|nr:DUF6090 family protein [Muricauda sp. NBRC 101325]GLU44368.1 hypothetical protein Musp01_19920 [Muricauda sp. NBRC 101325]
MNFIKRVRYNLIGGGKSGKYLKYAIGEIILVVIGILIAIQINSWQQAKSERILEKKYLNNLVGELRQDSIGLKNNLLQLKNQARTKEVFLDMVKGGVQGDSIIYFFDYQWKPILPYIPIKSTYIELTTNSHLRVIRSDAIREKIIKIYNSYESMEKAEDNLNQTATNHVIDLISRSIPDMSSYSVEDIMSLKSNTNLLNAIQLNGAYTRRDKYKKMFDDCSNLISEIENYRTTLD